MEMRTKDFPDCLHTDVVDKGVVPDDEISLETHDFLRRWAPNQSKRAKRDA